MASGLSLHYLPTSHKKDARLIGESLQKGNNKGSDQTMQTMQIHRLACTFVVLFFTCNKLRFSCNEADMIVYTFV